MVYQFHYILINTAHFSHQKKVNDHITIEEQLNGREKGITQFGRIVEELGITMFAASSPQAKGRIERLWETFQSRLVTDFRINKIKNIEDANNFLSGYIEIYNSKFAVDPLKSESVFLKLPKRYNLDELLCVRFERTIDNDLISKDSLDINSLDYHQWLPDVVIDLINEFYLKDAKAS